MNNPRGYRKWIAPVIIGILLIWLIVSIDLDAILEVLRYVDREALLISSLSILVGLQIIPLRWYLLQDDRQGFLHTYHTNAITFLARMFMPISIPLLRLATVTLTTPFTLTQIAPAIIAERIVETLMRGVALIIFVFSLRERPEWALLWMLILMALFVGFVVITSRSEEYFPRLTTWLDRRQWGKSPKLRRTLSSIGDGIAHVGTPSRLISSLLLSLLMGAFFLIGFAKLFEAVTLDGEMNAWLPLAAGVVFLLPPSTPLMIFLYQILIMALVLPLQIMDVNTALVYGILGFGVQMIFWLIAGVWGLTHTRLRFREILQMLDTVKEELSRGNEHEVEYTDGHDPAPGDAAQ